MLKYNVLAKRRKRPLNKFDIKKQSSSDDIENALILILNTLPFTKKEVSEMGYIDFLRLINKAKKVVDIKNQNNTDNHGDRRSRNPVNI